jgi:hypothetical protein
MDKIYLKVERYKPPEIVFAHIESDKNTFDKESEFIFKLFHELNIKDESMYLVKVYDGSLYLYNLVTHDSCSVKADVDFIYAMGMIIVQDSLIYKGKF